MAKKVNAENMERADKLQPLLNEWETMQRDIVENKKALQEALFSLEHAKEYYSKTGKAQPETDFYNLDAIEAAAHAPGIVDEWKRKRHAILAALSRHPYEDKHLAAEAIALLEQIKEATAEQEEAFALEIAAASKELEAAQKRLAAAQNARKTYRRENNSMLLNTFREAVREGKDVPESMYVCEQLPKPHTRMISALVSVYDTTAAACDMLGAEIEYVVQDAEQRRAIPERVPYIKAPEYARPIDSSPVSPEDLRYIGKHDGKTSFRDVLKGWF